MTVVLNTRSIEPHDSILSLALYGYACFTTFIVVNGSVKGLAHHLTRLGADAEAIFGIRPEETDIRNNVRRFLRLCESGDAIVVRVTVFPADFSLTRPEDISSLEILVTGRPVDLSAEKKPLSLAIVHACRTLPLRKSANMIVNLRARAMARDRGYDDALMVCNDVIVEGPTWNVFFQQDNALITPELGSGILPGVSRRLVAHACRKAGMMVLEERISIPKIEEFDGCFVSNSVLGPVPVESIDGHAYNADRSRLDNIVSLYASIPAERI